MKTLFLKVMLFLAPVGLAAGLVVSIDPYNLFGISSMINESVKMNTSRRLNYCLWKCVEFRKKPVDKILLGDSRMYNLDVQDINSQTGDIYYNFAYGGGTIPEIVDTFWYAARITKLKKVYIGLNFNLYNAKNNMNRFGDVDKILKNPIMYFIDHNVIMSCYYNIYGQYVDGSFLVGQPVGDKDSFWAHQLNATTKNFYSHYVYPSNYNANLKKIAEYCKHNNIELFFVIFPTHIELQDKIDEYGLRTEENTFKMDISKFGTVYDFDFKNKYTAMKTNFSDPYHYSNSQQIIDEVWGGKKHGIALEMK